MDKAQQDALKKAAGIEAAKLIQNLSLIHINEPTRLGMISNDVIC